MQRNADALSVDTLTLGLANNCFRLSLMSRPHCHNEVELNFVEQGAMTYLFGGQRARVEAGQIALFWATIPHQVIDADAQTTLHWMTVPLATFLQWQLPAALAQQVMCGRFVVSQDEECTRPCRSDQALFRQWYEDLRQNADEYRKIVLLEVEARLHRLGLAIAAHNHPPAEQFAPGTTHASGELSKVERIASFIAEHYTEPLSIERIAQVVHLHPNYTTSVFHKSFGMSIVNYITQYRVAHAQRLLVTTDENISTIALAAGFGSMSHFYCVFTKICAQSPAAYRAAFR